MFDKQQYLILVSQGPRKQKERDEITSVGSSESINRSRTIDSRSQKSTGPKQ